jgi:5'-nucleotidase
MIQTSAISARRFWTIAIVVLMVASLFVLVAPGADAARTRDPVAFTLTVLHNNDGESELLMDSDGVGGIAQFKGLVDELRAEGRDLAPGEERNRYSLSKYGAVLLTSGDNTLASPEWTASLEKGVPFYDSIAHDKIHYDAIVLGNHDFDFGPDVLAQYIEGFNGEVSRTLPWFLPIGRLFRPFFTNGTDPTFLSANLDFSAEPVLADLVAEGKIAKSTVVVEGGQRIGIVGASPLNLEEISSPRNVEVVADTIAAVQAEIDKLRKQGVRIIIFSSHLQGIDDDVDLIPQLRGVDIAIAGGGDELLASADDTLLPGDEPFVYDDYPIMVTDGQGRDIPIVTTSGDYRYLGQLVVDFDRRGEVVSIDLAASGPQPVVGITPDAELQEIVEAPVQAYVDTLSATVIGTTEVQLEGRREPGVRTQETNLGSLMADSMRWQATELAAAYGTPEADIALQNGGGIRNNDLRPATVPGPITEKDTFDIAPFSNFVVIFPAITRENIKELLEHAYAELPGADGRFAQLSGITVNVDTTQPAGSRVTSAVLDDGTMLVDGGVVVAGGDVSLATIDFLARGGDGYPFPPGFVSLGTSYQLALSNYIQDGLGGVISAADYAEVPTGGGSRIIIN